MVQIVTLPGNRIALDAPYNSAAADAVIQSVSGYAREWDHTNRRFTVLDTPRNRAALTQIAQRFYGANVGRAAQAAPAAVQTKLFEMHYLGRVKDRGGDEQTAFGWADGKWRLVFPEQVLRDWFGAEKRPGEEASLYSALAVAPEATAAEIKSGWRRLIRQWHPDVNRDPDAARQFQAIQAAYETLSDPARRARYDAGLALERSLRGAAGVVFNTAAALTLGYRSPLCCGYVMVEGSERGGRFVVSKILEWQDITNERGEILVTSWPEGADMFQERWVRA